MVQVNLLASDRVDGIFIYVYAKARHLAEGVQNGFDGFNVFLFGAYEDRSIIGVHGRPPFCCGKRQLRKDIAASS
jgi:hypothetical protein